MVLPLHNIQNLFPLVLSGVNTSGVVGTDMHDDYLLTLGLVKVFAEALIVEIFCLGVIVPVVGPLKAAFVCNGSVDWPGLVRNEDFCALLWVPLLEEFEAQSDGACS